MSAPRSVTLAADWDQHYDIATNRANSTSTSFSSANHHHLPYFVGNDRDPYRLTSSPATASSQPSSQQSRSTLWWGDLEPWMDEEYAKQVCALMGWDPISIKVPRPVSDGPQSANNPGYCFLTFPSPSHAANVLSQVQNGTPPTMPNSSKPFVLNWASLTSPNQLQPSASSPVAPSYPKEYSIFVGDLAPETSNSDLVAVFRNPVLGLRNDREPKFIRPFLSCKSAKIMLDPVTGISRGYGFVRYTITTFSLPPTDLSPDLLMRLTNSALSLRCMGFIVFPGQVNAVLLLRQATYLYICSANLPRHRQVQGTDIW